jgi:hypothetical protein
MEDLTGRFPAGLTPSSQASPGPTAQGDLHKMTRSGPGTDSVVNIPDLLDPPEENPSSGPVIPVSHPGQHSRVVEMENAAGAGGFHTITIGGVWKELP